MTKTDSTLTTSYVLAKARRHCAKCLAALEDGRTRDEMNHARACGAWRRLLADGLDNVSKAEVLEAVKLSTVADGGRVSRSLD
jgi:hypothetical protein